MDIFIVEKSAGRYDSHHMYNLKGFFRAEDALAFKAAEEAAHASMMKMLARVAVWFEKWEKVNPAPEYKQVHEGYHLNEEQDNENMAAYELHVQAREAWFDRWYKSYCAYAKLHDFVPANRKETSWIRGFEDDSSCVNGFTISILEVA
jgi:hypothetical protein